MFFPLIILTVFFLLFYIKKKYFTLYGPIPGIPPTLLLGNIIESGQLFGGASIADAINTMSERLGPIYRIWVGPVNMIVVSNVEDVQHIFNHRNIYDQGIDFIEKVSVIFPNGLICLTGTAFKRHAAVTIPLFRRAKVVPYLDLLIEMSDRLLNLWKKNSPTEINTNISRQCQNLLLQVFGYIGFDYDLGVLPEDGDVAETKDEIANAFYDMLSMFPIMFFAPKHVSVMYTKISRRYQKARATIDKCVGQMVEKELNMSAESREERKRTCLIASLVASLQTDENGERKTPDENRRGLTRREIIDEAVLFLVAGYETTATALAWSIFWLSKQPDVQRKLKDELAEKSSQGNLTLEVIDSLTYLDCVVKEVLRMTPPLAAVQRTLTCDDTLPESGYRLKRGESILIAVERLSHDPRYWKLDPEQFIPERFLGEDKDYHPFTLIPFGSGHRQCIGQELARFELKVFLARLMQIVTFVDGGPELNTGGYSNKSLTLKPKQVAVSIIFDDQ